jgi:hypothetical protein
VFFCCACALPQSCDPRSCGFRQRADGPKPGAKFRSALGKRNHCVFHANLHQSSSSFSPQLFGFRCFSPPCSNMSRCDVCGAKLSQARLNKGITTCPRHGFLLRRGGQTCCLVQGCTMPASPYPESDFSVPAIVNSGCLCRSHNKILEAFQTVKSRKSLHCLQQQAIGALQRWQQAQSSPLKDAVVIVRMFGRSAEIMNLTCAFLKQMLVPFCLAVSFEDPCLGDVFKLCCAMLPYLVFGPKGSLNMTRFLVTVARHAGYKFVWILDDNISKFNLSCNGQLYDMTPTSFQKMLQAGCNSCLSSGALACTTQALGRPRTEEHGATASPRTENAKLRSRDVWIAQEL